MTYRDTTPQTIGAPDHPTGSREWVREWWDGIIHRVRHELDQAPGLDSDERDEVLGQLREWKRRAVDDAPTAADLADELDDADELPDDFAQDGPADA